jgi:hypothetical protein
MSGYQGRVGGYGVNGDAVALASKMARTVWALWADYASAIAVA